MGAISSLEVALPFAIEPVGFLALLFSQSAVLVAPAELTKFCREIFGRGLYVYWLPSHIASIILRSCLQGADRANGVTTVPDRRGSSQQNFFPIDTEL